MGSVLAPSDSSTKEVNNAAALRRPPPPSAASNRNVNVMIETQYRLYRL